MGDSGTGGAGARSVRDAYLGFAAGAPPDLWIMLGDNAYPSGTDAQYQSAVFDVYQAFLATSALWPTFGNHDGSSADSATQSGPYYDVFTLPAAAQAGGVASGTEAYYSFNVGRVHLVCLDSFESSRAANRPMATWLAADLAAAAQADWAVAFWHHPPYSKGTHDSDIETELVQMRQNLVPVLEAGGVDLVLTGHSHAYERSPLLDGHYGLSTTLQAAMVRDAGDGRVAGDGAYAKPGVGLAAHGGTVYVVAGSGAQADGGALDHPAMPFALDELGSLVLDVVGQTLSVRFLSDSGRVRDAFTITKGAVATHAASGAIAYYHGGEPVPGVALSGAEQSHGDGAFSIAVPHGAPLGLLPARRGGVGNAVSALDAAWVLQVVAGLRSFDAMQRRACDTSGNGALSALDATHILRRAVDDDVQLPIATQCGSDFLFQPAVVGPIAGRSQAHQASGGACQPGAIELEPVVAATAGLDFTAAAFGDCTGNWSAAPALRRQVGAAAVRVGRLRRHGRAWRLPVSVSGVGFSAVALALDLAPGQSLRAARALGAHAALVAIGRSGRRVAIASPQPLRRLHLELRGDGPPSASPVRLAASQVDESPGL
ncbi:MAG: metallophosphoesterase [Candidatus Binatia bacterium]